jgi:cell division protein FtsW
MFSDAKKGRIDIVLLLTVFVLLVFSIVMITSIGVPKSISLTKPSDILFPSCGEDGVDCFFLLRRHVIRIAFGFVALFIGLKVPIRVWRKVAIPMFFVIFASLVLVLIIGSTVNTTARAWFVFSSTSVQPVELAKLMIIFYLAAWMERKGRDIADFKNGFISFCVINAIIILPVLLQPDFGSTLVFVIVATAIYFVAGARVKHLALGLVVVLMLGLITIPNVKYLKYRFGSFLNPTVENCQPETAAGEIRRNYCWQTDQSQIAIGSGGFFGKGLTQGIQKSYWLPQATDDFIFAASAEELGFLRIFLVIIAYAIIAYRGYMISNFAQDKFNMYVAVGITTWITTQAFINIAVNIGLMPVTGITLPFISYGGTSMIATLAGIGVLLQISRTTTPYYANNIYGRRDRGTHIPKHSGYRRG